MGLCYPGVHGLGCGLVLGAPGRSTIAGRRGIIGNAKIIFMDYDVGMYWLVPPERHLPGLKEMSDLRELKIAVEAYPPRTVSRLVHERVRSEWVAPPRSWPGPMSAPSFLRQAVTFKMSRAGTPPVTSAQKMAPRIHLKTPVL